MNSTPLINMHQSLGAKIIDFYGWQMPLHYGSQTSEHHAVRQAAGIFDVSHMTTIDITGPNSTDFLRWLIPADVARMALGKATYSALLNHQGGIIDDLLVYFMEDGHYRLITNCGTRETVLQWLHQCQAEKKHLDLTIHEHEELAILAIQGPQAIAKCQDCLPEYSKLIDQLKPFTGALVGSAWVTRTGYTGESGLEIVLPNDAATHLWQQLIEHDVRPVGLGARDTLRLEAGLNLYGQDMDDKRTPLEANMNKFIDWRPESRDFIGREALLQQKKQSTHQKLVGLALQEPGVPRQGYSIYSNDKLCGVITSGIMSPTLKQGIALARVDGNTPDQISVAIRNTQKAALLVRLPFYRSSS